MLGKLLKHEINATYKLLLPLNLLIFILGLMTRFTFINGQYYNSTENNMATFASALILLLYVVGIFVISFANLLKLSSRYYKNFFTDQGYLTFTLPVKPSTLYHVKVINSIIWYLFNLICIIASVVVLFIGEVRIKDISASIGVLIQTVASRANVSQFYLIMIFIITAFIGIIMQILMIYTAISLGHTFSKHKIVSSVFIYIGLSIAFSWINNIIETIFKVPHVLTGTFNLNTIYLGITHNIVYCIILYLISTYCITKKLNLE